MKCRKSGTTPACTPWSYTRVNLSCSAKGSVRCQTPAASLTQNTPGSERPAIFPSRAMRKGHSARWLSQHHLELHGFQLSSSRTAQVGRQPCRHHSPTSTTPLCCTSPGLSSPWCGLARKEGSTRRGWGWGQRCFSSPQPGGLPQICSPFHPLNPRLHKLGSRVLALQSSET